MLYHVCTPDLYGYITYKYTMDAIVNPRRSNYDSNTCPCELVCISASDDWNLGEKSGLWNVQHVLKRLSFSYFVQPLFVVRVDASTRTAQVSLITHSFAHRYRAQIQENSAN